MSPVLWGFITGTLTYIGVNFLMKSITPLPGDSCWIIGVATGILVWTHVEEFLLWRINRKRKDFQ